MQASLSLGTAEIIQSRFYKDTVLAVFFRVLSIHFLISATQNRRCELYSKSLTQNGSFNLVAELVNTALHFLFKRCL